MNVLGSWFGSRPTSNTKPHAPDQPLVATENDPSADPRTLPRDPSKPETSSKSLIDPELATPASSRQQKAPVVFLAGLAFTAISLLITRRSLARRRLGFTALQKESPAKMAKAHSPPVSPAMEALEALHIATINVLSVATAATGGILWYLDIANLEDARRKLRGGMGFDGSGRSESDAEEDFEEWLATVLSRKEAKERQKELKGEKEELWRNDRGRER